ncbi:hypothetical protein [Actinomadura sp. 3N407]|uniref:hypothetical protein n=1 Tax=Actinomadura sp. 3N407 TaxID=3457423 RepID=UPI003FCEA3A4
MLVRDIFEDRVRDALSEATKWLVEGMVRLSLDIFETVLAWWLGDAIAPPLSGEQGGVLWFLRSHTNWLTVALAFSGLLIAAAKVALQRKGEPFRKALFQFIELAIVVSMLATAVHLATRAGDEYSTWILKEAQPVGDDWIDGWTSGLDALGGEDANLGYAALVFIFALFAIPASAIQFILLLFRSAILVVLVGIFPVLAAARFSSYGDRAYRTSIGWLISFIFYKPVAATIYAAAIKMLSSDYKADHVLGLALICCAVFALPATMRAVMPGVTRSNEVGLSAMREAARQWNMVSEFAEGKDKTPEGSGEPADGGSRGGWPWGFPRRPSGGGADESGPSGSDGSEGSGGPMRDQGDGSNTGGAGADRAGKGGADGDGPSGADGSPSGDEPPVGGGEGPFYPPDHRFGAEGQPAGSAIHPGDWSMPLQDWSPGSGEQSK